MPISHFRCWGFTQTPRSQDLALGRKALPSAEMHTVRLDHIPRLFSPSWLFRYRFLGESILSPEPRERKFSPFLLRILSFSLESLAGQDLCCTNRDSVETIHGSTPRHCYRNPRPAWNCSVSSRAAVSRDCPWLTVNDIGTRWG